MGRGRSGSHARESCVSFKKSCDSSTQGAERQYLRKNSKVSLFGDIPCSFFFFSSILAYLLFSFFASTCLHIWPTVILSLSLLFFFFCSCHKLPLSSCKWRSVSIGRTGKKKALEIRKPPQFTLISSFTPFYTTILLAPLVITVFFFDFSKPKLYLTEPLSCFFFFPPRIYIYTLLHTTHYTHSGKFFSHFFRSFFFFSFSCTCI